MNVLYVEDILEAGFTYIPVQAISVSGGGKDGVVVLNRFMVHSSVKLTRTCILHASGVLEVPGNFPYIECYFPAAEWRAYAGAMTFHLTSEIQLWRFMKIFNYPLPIDKQ